MNRIIEVLFLVLGQLAVGGMVLLGMEEIKTVGIGFYRLIAFVFLIVMGVGLWAMPAELRASFDLSPTGLMPIFLFLFAVLLLIYNLYLWIDGSGLGLPFLHSTSTIGILAIILSAMHYVDPILFPLRGILLAASFLLSSLVLGAGVLGMLLGHSYLTRPSLSLVPLKKLARLFLILMVAQAGISLLNLAAMPHNDRFWEALLLGNFEGLYLWIRILIGIAGPILLAWMVVQTVAERATMSATGLLYIAMVMVMVGEVFSRFFLLVDSMFL
jgi:protein NrfD